MGNLFTKNTHTHTDTIHYTTSQKEIKNNNYHICKTITNEDIKEIIQHYEHIKNTKHIEDMDKLITIMGNTNWDAIDTTNKIIQPSAPPLCISIPIAIPISIESDYRIK